MRACTWIKKKRRTQSLEKREVIARCVLGAWANYMPKKGGNCHIRRVASLNCPKPYWLRNLWRFTYNLHICDWASLYVSPGVEASFHYWQFFGRLTLYYTAKNYFLSTFFQTWAISNWIDFWLFTKDKKYGIINGGFFLFFLIFLNLCQNYHTLGCII